MVLGLSALAACSTTGGESGDLEAAQAHIAAGKAEAEKGRHSEAIDQFTKAVAAHPELSDAYFHRGCSYVRLRLGQEMQGDSRVAEDKALKDFDMALRVNPAHGKAYYNRAMVLAARANYRAAAEDLLQACQYDSRNPEPHLQLGRVYEDKFEDRGLAALEHYEKYADLGGRDPATLDKVRAWREIKKQSAPPAPSSKPPTVDDEKKAAELHDEFKRLFRENKKAEALKLIETLLGQYGGTAYVRERAREFSALLAALKK
ncbi:MAG TPA: tetratricopeptide repeat protein [Planctomycetota bacterium]